MAHLLAIFRHNNCFQSYINSKHLANHGSFPSQLLTQIKCHPKQFAQFLTHHHQQSIQEIQKLTLVHLLVLHAPELLELAESLPLTLRSKDSWINGNIMVPYQNFIRKLILSSEQYQCVRTINNGWNSIVGCPDSFPCKEDMRQNPKEYFNFKVLCYCVNMLKDLFSFLKKVPTLGRYYPKSANSCFASFVSAASYQTVLFYFCFKFVARELLLRHHEYLPTEHEQKFFRDILELHLESMNEEMKVLMLNKYYNPIDRGIKVTLFELDRMPEDCRQALYELNILQRQSCERAKKNRQFLGKKIFAGGEFDSGVFEESLHWISSREYQQKDLSEIYDKENMNGLNRPAQRKVQKKGRAGGLEDISNILAN